MAAKTNFVTFCNNANLNENGVAEMIFFTPKDA